MVSENPAVKVQRLSSTDGFIVWDLEAASTSVGVARLAPKVLQDGAALLARSVTYTFAAFGVTGHGGASAAVNAKPEDREAALGAFIGEVRPLAENGQLRLWPGLGVTATDLAPLGWDEPDPALLAQGALAAAKAIIATVDGSSDGALEDRKVTVVGAGPATDAVSSAAKDAGTELTEARFGVETDILFVAGKAGCLDHNVAETVQARVVVPLSPVPVTARALAILGRAGCAVVPDFLSTAAPLLTTYDPDGGEPTERITQAVSDVADEGTGLWLAAALKAEERLASWTDEQPFGRPLA